MNKLEAIAELWHLLTWIESPVTLSQADSVTRARRQREAEAIRVALAELEKADRVNERLTGSGESARR